ncbi:glycosyltransferase [Roseisolibacter sp. H3M3-2]|uniref:glycosyltransferase n=1 Tax=Roseisolibacter sp. H3M3-2 TaxID=3031323 RepID=UPI0023D9DD53|nr:glycosyltransferase [Roseisolibacter sp. H3M3-2]MDF1501890.1 glycosyltransferase [Roseisolibacter sp. H3M3-2]
MSHAPSPPPTTLVVPCYNEASRLDLPAFAQALAEQSALALLFVDDGSADATRALLDAFADAHPGRVGVYAMSRNGGKAAAVRAGLLRALSAAADGECSIVGYWDADLATPLPVAAEMAALLHDRPACVAVLGSRVRLLGRCIDRRPVRHYLGRVFATVASAALRMPVYDTQCGAKLFRAGPALARALEAPFTSRWAFDVELLARLREATGWCDADESFVELPLLAWHDVAGSKMRAGAALRAGLDLLRIAATVRGPDRRSVSPLAGRPPVPTARP